MPFLYSSDQEKYENNSTQFHNTKIAIAKFDGEQFMLRQKDIQDTKPISLSACNLQSDQKQLEPGASYLLMICKEQSGLKTYCSKMRQDFSCQYIKLISLVNFSLIFLFKISQNTAQVDIHYKGKTLNQKIRSQDDVQQICKTFMIQNNIDKQYEQLLQNKFSSAQQKLKIQQIKQQTRKFQSESFEDLLSSFESANSNQNFTVQKNQNPQIQKYLLQTMNTQNIQQQKENKQQQEYETLQEEFDNEVNTENLFKRKNQNQQSQINTTLQSRETYAQNTNGLMNMIKQKNQQKSKQEQINQYNKTNIQINRNPTNTMNKIQKAADERVPKVFSRLYNQGKIKKATNYQPRDKKPDSLEIQPEITEKFTGNKITQELTKNYNQKEQIQTQMKNYEQKRMNELLQTTTNKNVLENLIRNMNQKDKQYWRDQFQKRINKQDQIENKTEDMELQHQKIDGRDVYVFETRQYTYKPKINNYEKVMKNLKNQQLLLKGKKLDEQICKINNVKPMQQYDFQPKINKYDVDFAQNILAQLTN